MTVSDEREMRLPGVLVPEALLQDSARFGGLRQGDCRMGDLVLRQGRAAQLAPATQPAHRMVLPRLTEPHVHLDKCHTVDRLGAVGGDLEAAIAAQGKDRDNWSADDLRARAGRGLGELVSAGCGVVRSHVDWSDEADHVPVAWEILGDLAAEMGDRVVLQRAALTGIDQLADAGFARAFAARITLDGGVLGSFVLNQPERRAGIENAFRVAGEMGLALDFHVDEGLAPGLDGLEMIADAALAMRHAGPVLCGHGCSLANLCGDDLKRVADKLARAGIALTVLPATNLYLQDRRACGPDRRGLAPLNALRAAGVRVVLGADNVRDAFCPIGRHDPLHTLGLAVMTAHLDPPFGPHLRLITHEARAALGLAPRPVDGAHADELVVFDAASTSELITGAGVPRPLSEICKERVHG